MGENTNVGRNRNGLVCKKCNWVVGWIGLISKIIQNTQYKQQKPWKIKNFGSQGAQISLYQPPGVDFINPFMLFLYAKILRTFLRHKILG